MKIEINHRPHKDFRKRNYKDQQNRQSQKSKVLGPIIKSKNNKILSESFSKPPQFQKQKTLVQKNSLRNSGLYNPITDNIENWSKEKLNETVKSDEFVNNGLFAQPQQRSNNPQNLEQEIPQPVFEDGVYHAHLLKTTNSYFTKTNNDDKFYISIKKNSPLASGAPYKDEQKVLPPLKNKSQ